MNVYLDNTLDAYRTFLRIKELPRYEIHGRMAVVPDEYAATLGLSLQAETPAEYVPRPGLFDYQEAIVRLAIAKRKFAIFADCGLGKTLMELEFARYVLAAQRRNVLMVAPLMVVSQTIEECRKFYGDTLPIEQIAAKDLAKWLRSDAKGRLGITNYDALRDDTPAGHLGGLILDESSMLKSHYGKWGQVCLRMGAGIDYKLACTGTPAPNDRIEYANHAVFLDAFPNVNAFLARFFVNRGQTNERWELKPHALRPFYRALSHWSIFLTDPSTYGWKDNVHSIPPIHVHIDDVRLSDAQERAGAKTATFLRALPKHQGDIDALRDLSLFDNAANGKSISSDETYAYCAHEVISKNGGLSAGMPDSKFITKMFRRWDGRGITKSNLIVHVRSLMAKMRCNSIGLATPAGRVDLFAKLWHWDSDPAFDSLAKAVCPAADQKDVLEVLKEAKKHKRSAADALSEVAKARRGYRTKEVRQKQDAATILRWRCDDIRDILTGLDSDMALDFAMLDSIEAQMEEISVEAHEAISRLRAKIGGLVHA